MALGQVLTDLPQTIAPNLAAVQLPSAPFLQRGWEEVKQIEGRYLRSPFLNKVYGEELPILPGLDSAIALNALSKYHGSGNYDVIVFDGYGDISTLRLFGTPDSLSWYLRRFREVIEDSDLWKTLTPILQPVIGTISNLAWTGESIIQQPYQEAVNFLSKGAEILSDPSQLVAYLITNPSPYAIAEAKYLWGSAQQVNLTIAGVLHNRGTEPLGDEFAPLPVTNLPVYQGENWQSLVSSLPDLRQVGSPPKPIVIDPVNRQVTLYLPGFDKTQVKLTQSGPEITIEAGDQRRNILLPPPLKNAAVKGAKFQNHYLIISL
jgi:arsenite-transporting ATPase